MSTRRKGPSLARTFEISEETYRALVAVAAERGEQPEEVLQSWLTDVRERARPAKHLAVPHGAAPALVPDGDPLAPFLGAFEATDADATVRHDDYLADAYTDAHAAER